LGLLLGGLFHSAAQVYTWSRMVLYPIIGPAFVAGLRYRTRSSSRSAHRRRSRVRIMTNGLAGWPLFNDPWISRAVLVCVDRDRVRALAWRLVRRES